ncbi:hypothetical protein ELH91_27925 (plasmid) [Rhizobium leguminosarum]|nr:hypothetical protein ELI40_30870 [Rhizobium leguminosarum]TAV82227.1 hypothetical protein ELI21_31125 [Rhizobium leguminosarum]TAV82643.1 hypothetical protein ELI22_31950 [Rhizobium leguminosarum]TAW26218.1 hypothetical protein ELI23_32280 [Rhizobium leguminosarum]TAX02962.1 hypothetical protein ELI07_31715 [Rhizobium leguminosarum]
MPRQATLEGSEIPYVPGSLAREFLAVPKLAAVLADWSPRLPGLMLYYPGNRHVPSALRAFIDLL